VGLSPVVTTGTAPTIKRAVDIRRILSQGRRASGELVTLYVLRVDGESRAAFASSRSVGGAVVRNRARRLMREAWRAVRPRAIEGHWIVFVARPQIAGARLEDLMADVNGVLSRTGVVE
jgi:ribonuclease P protein component